jgi:hypothetical protein
MNSRSTVSWLGPLGVGAAAMFLLDPSRGRRRRAVLRDKGMSLARRSRAAAGGVAQDLQNRAHGLMARVHDTDDYAQVDDAVVVARVRSAIGRVCTHPGSLAVSSVNGVVELNGPVLAREHDDVLRTVEGTRGVVAVIDHMTQHEDADSIPGLQGEGSLPADRGWSRTGIAALCGALALCAFAARRRRYSR